MPTQFLPAASLRGGDLLPAARDLVRRLTIRIAYGYGRSEGRFSASRRISPCSQGAGSENSDDPLAAQGGDLGRGVAEALDDLVGVLAEQRGGPAVGARGLGELDRGR